MTEFSTASCRLISHKNPKDPWADQKEIPLPSVDKSIFYNSNTLPGNEEWNKPQQVPMSGEETFDWPAYNNRVYVPDGTFRPAFVCHMRTKIKYSPDKMWYIASFIRGMTVDEALKQLQFKPQKGCRVVEEVLQEARDLALKEHHFEFSTNMWVAESFCDMFDIIKGIRRHGKGRLGTVKYRYISYFVRLEEGVPPEHYYDHKAPKTTHQWLESFVQEHREKFIHKW